MRALFCMHNHMINVTLMLFLSIFFQQRIDALDSDVAAINQEMQNDQASNQNIDDQSLDNDQASEQVADAIPTANQEQESPQEVSKDEPSIPETDVLVEQPDITAPEQPQEKLSEKSPSEKMNNEPVLQEDKKRKKNGIQEEKQSSDIKSRGEEISKTENQQESAKTLPEEPETEIDTIDLDEGGNWLLKRKALEDTAETIEKINGVFLKIIDASTQYKIDRNKIDNELDLLITTIGFGLGDLDKTLATLLDNLDKERKEDGDLSAQERDILHSAQEKKQEVTQLRDSLQSLFGLEQNVDGIVDTVDSQIKIAGNYQSQAWKNFQEIKKVLSDEKAEDLYYRTEGLFQSMQDILIYLDEKLLNYFNEQLQELRNKMSEVRNKVQSLKDKGIDLQSKFQEVEEQENKEKEQENKQAIQASEFFFMRWLRNIGSLLYSPIRLIQEGWSYLVSSKPVKAVQAPAEQTSQEQSAQSAPPDNQAG